MDLLDSCKYKCSVSSVLNRDVKQHGKQFMFDTEDDTAWCSSEGTPQWILIQFVEPQTISGFSFQFQGGFVGQDPNFSVEDQDGRNIIDEDFYPEDINSVQNFILKTKIVERTAVKIKILFKTSTDFFGRIIVYKLKIFP